VAADAIDLERVKLADFQYNQCGRPTMPDGARYIDIPKSLVYNNVIAASGQLPDERQSTHSNTVFMLRSIQAQVTPATINLTVRIQWPDGNFLSNVPTLFYLSYGLGFERRLFRRPVIIRPGEQIRIQFINSTATQAQLVFAFEGVLRYYLKDRTSPACCIDRL
jgi:hypothetical protein